ncbi:hypothetical protein [Arthrobacter sp. ISL-95]|nr:hypothetical protein [Arthrobacter sp. ISL-95]MBT2587906.1 hypothetical protein [Arthrobacter sp. ISL-95]
MAESESDAERRIKQAIFLIENDWGCGKVDVAEILAVLRGTPSSIFA